MEHTKLLKHSEFNVILYINLIKMQRVESFIPKRDYSKVYNEKR